MSHNNKFDRNVLTANAKANANFNEGRVLFRNYNPDALKIKNNAFCAHLTVV